MKDEDLKFEEIEVSLTLVDLDVVDTTLLSDTVVILCLLWNDKARVDIQASTEKVYNE